MEEEEEKGREQHMTDLHAISRRKDGTAEKYLRVREEGGSFSLCVSIYRILPLPLSQRENEENNK